MTDLGRWLTGGYGVPLEPDPLEEDAVPGDADPPPDEDAS